MTADSQNSDRTNAREAEARRQKTWDERGIFPPPRPAGAMADKRVSICRTIGNGATCILARL